MSTTVPRTAVGLPSLRRVLWLLAPPVLFVAVVLHAADLSALWGVLTSAVPLWVLIAALLAVAFAVNQGALYRSIFAVLGQQVALGRAVGLSLVMAFASLALPAGTASGIAYFVSVARERGIASSRALLAALAYYLFDYGALLPVLLIGMTVLRLRHDLGPAAVAALALFYTLALGTAGLMAWGLLHPVPAARRVEAAAAWLHRALRWLGWSIPSSAAAAFAGEIEDVLMIARRRPARSMRPLLHAAAGQALALGLLDVVFIALGFPVAPAVLIAGYAVGTVFMLVSITPSGAGVVEGAMTVTFTSLGVPLEIAAAATVLFRLYTFWLPMLAGFLTLRSVRLARA